jgi:hypothetical protein
MAKVVALVQHCGMRLLVVLEGLARQAVDAADEDDPRRWVVGWWHTESLLTCGLVLW